VHLVLLCELLTLEMSQTAGGNIRRAAMTSDKDVSDATLVTAQQGAFCSPLIREVSSLAGL